MNKPTLDVRIIPATNGMLRSRTDFKNAFPESLRNHASAKGLFGGELLFDKMNFFERIIVRSKSGARGNVYHLNQPAIQSFIECFRDPGHEISSTEEPVKHTLQHVVT